MYDYQSDATKFLNEYIEKHPEEAERRLKNRDLLWDVELKAEEQAAFAAASPDFQDEHGYEKDRPGQADLSMATNWVGNTFDCLAYTLEMPFKDNHNLPDDDFGWNGQRSLRLGEAVLSAILNVLPELRP